MKDFLTKVELSELTIKKIVKELDRLFKTNYLYINIIYNIIYPY